MSVERLTAPSASSPVARSTDPSTIEFTIKLNDEGMSLSNAYVKATGEFVKLRARYEMAQIASELEARHHGAEFSETPIVRSFLGRPNNILLICRNDTSERNESTLTRIWTLKIEQPPTPPRASDGSRQRSESGPHTSTSTLCCRPNSPADEITSRDGKHHSSAGQPRARPAHTPTRPTSHSLAGTPRTYLGRVSRQSQRRLAISTFCARALTARTSRDAFAWDTSSAPCDCNPFALHCFALQCFALQFRFDRLERGEVGGLTRQDCFHRDGRVLRCQGQIVE